MDPGSKTVQDGGFTAEFDSMVSKSMEHWKVPGLSIAIIDNASILAKVCLN